MVDGINPADWTPLGALIFVIVFMFVGLMKGWVVVRVQHQEAIDRLTTAYEREAQAHAVTREQLSKALGHLETTESVLRSVASLAREPGPT